MLKYKLLTAFIFLQSLQIFGQNPLYIPPALTGTSFTLNVQTGSQTYFGSTPTPTYGVNGPSLAPTIFINKGDSIQLNVQNNLTENTTMHWHGLHVAPKNDGGPHQVISPSTTWSPSFVVRNNAGTYWYHPHGAAMTERQVAKGIVGMMIVRDNAEAALNLPRTYGTDDFPLILQSKAFDALTQISIATEMDTALFVNETWKPVLNAPAQVIRLRIVNASSLRTYQLGFSNGQTFYQIATDGGMRATPIAGTRFRLSPGERVEVLVDFTGMDGQNLFLKSFSSELLTGIYGANTMGNATDTIEGYEENMLNGADFDLLHFQIIPQTTGAITTIPTTLVPFTPIDISTATTFRTIVMDTIRLLSFETPNRAEGPFGMNNASFNMDSINEVVHLGETEIWTLVNKTLVAHPFHIHDIQFNVIEKHGTVTPITEVGWKDVVLVEPGDSVKFITKFENFSDPIVPYMYHCHLLHHEDDGMMGSFLVIDASTVQSNEKELSEVTVFPNPVTNEIQIQSNVPVSGVDIYDLAGRKLLSMNAPQNNLKIPVAQLPGGMYLITINTADRQFIKKLIKN